MVESQPSKLLVAGSIPVSRSNLRSASIASRATVGKPDLAGQAAVGRADLSAEAPLVRRSAAREGGRAKADVAQLAERVLGKDEVTSSILVIGSTRLGRVAASLVAGTRRARRRERNLQIARAHTHGERKI